MAGSNTISGHFSSLGSCTSPKGGERHTNYSGSGSGSSSGGRKTFKKQLTSKHQLTKFSKQ